MNNRTPENSLVVTEKGESQNSNYKKIKHAEFTGKRKFSYYPPDTPSYIGWDFAFEIP